MWSDQSMKGYKSCVSVSLLFQALICETFNQVLAPWHVIEIMQPKPQLSDRKGYMIFFPYYVFDGRTLTAV